MKRFSPADPAKFKPLEFRRQVFRQPAWPQLPPPDKATRLAAGAVAFLVLL